MNRIEMYNTIKENGLAEEFKEKFGKNFTQGKNTELEEFVNLKLKKSKVKSSEDKIEKKVEEEIKEVKEVKEEIPEKKTVIDTSSENVKKGTYVNKAAFIELISILQSEACIKNKEAERILELI